MWWRTSLLIVGLACVADAYKTLVYKTPGRPSTGAERAQSSFMSFGFEQCTDAAAVRKRYRELANELHPDRPGGDLDSFKLMADAYKRRLNTMSKLSSDAELKDALAELAAVLLALFKQAVQEAMAGSWKLLITGVQEVAAEATRDGSASRYDSARRDGPAIREGSPRAPSTVRVGAPRRVLNAIGNVFKGITDRGTAEPPPPSPPPADDRRRQQPFKPASPQPAPPSKDRRTEPPRK